MKMKKALDSLSSLFFLILCLRVERTLSQSRSTTVEVKCGRIRIDNSSVFIRNFVATMENINVQVRTTGYGVAQTGEEGPNKVYGQAQCYGDLTLVDCVVCYAELRALIPGCFPYTTGTIFLDGCYTHVSNYSFYEEFKGPDDRAKCGNITRKGPRFLDSARRAVLDAIAVAPARGGYARSQILVSGQGNQSAYVLANCWKSLNESSCKACLEHASASAMTCLPWSEGRALHRGCFLRYSDVDFLNVEQKADESSKGTITVRVVASVSSVVLLAIVAATAISVRKKRRIQRKRKGSDDSLIRDMAKILHDSSLNFKFSTLDKATGSFDEANKLGQGGFGTVYKGVLADGREIAVKRLFFNNRNRAADFYNEVNMISSLEHRNLVRLLGCSCSGPESLLVYEYLPNMSLDRFLFDANKGKALNWERRLKIIIGTADGLAYLHENSKIRIIHRDIKASNILLDLKFRAKIADFGLARSFQDDKSHISTAIAGTLGYMAPEYIAHGQLTDKADVYSFGVLLLEVVTGRQNNWSKNMDDADSLITATWRHFQSDTVAELFDPNNLMLHNYENEDSIKEDMLRVAHIGLLCTQEVHTLRPTMPKALDMLLKKDYILPAPTNPPFVDETTMELTDLSDDPGNPLNNGTSSGSLASVSHSISYPRWSREVS